MSETSLRANSCIELSEIKKLDSLLRQCETLSYDDLSSSSNGDRELADYMEPKGRMKRRNSSATLITTPPIITQTAIRALSSLNIFSSAKKIMRMVNENPLSYYDRNCALPQMSQEGYKTKSCSNLQKPSLCYGKPKSNENSATGADHFFSISENILTTADKGHTDDAECDCHCPPAPHVDNSAGDSGKNGNPLANPLGLGQKQSVYKRRHNERQSNNYQHQRHQQQQQHNHPSKENATSPTACSALRRPHKSDQFVKQRRIDPDDENRIVNINETPNIVPISLNDVNDSSSYEGACDEGPAAIEHRTSSSIRHQKSLDNKSDKSQLSQANSTRSRSKFSPQYLSRKISCKATSIGGIGSGGGGGGEAELAAEAGAKELLLGHKFEKILPEPVETVSTSSYTYANE